MLIDDAPIAEGFIDLLKSEGISELYIDPQTAHNYRWSWNNLIMAYLYMYAI